jgi:hypothetical protein
MTITAIPSPIPRPNSQFPFIDVKTPLDASPLITAYVDYEIYSFVAANTSSGAVTMTVVPRTGTLATLKAYVGNGATQANTGDIVAGSQYFAIYNAALDAAAGGFVIK